MMMSPNYGLLAFDPMRSFFARNFHSSPPTSTASSNGNASSSNSGTGNGTTGSGSVNMSSGSPTLHGSTDLLFGNNNGENGSSSLMSKIYGPEPPLSLQQQQQQQQQNQSQQLQQSQQQQQQQQNLGIGQPSAQQRQQQQQQQQQLQQSHACDGDSIMAEIAAAHSMHKIMQHQHQHPSSNGGGGNGNGGGHNSSTTISGIELHEQMSAHLAAAAVTAGDKDFLCEICCKRFTQKGNLKTHIRSVHTKEKPFCCPVCGKCFSQKGNMQTHTRTHNKDDRFPCVLCGKTFSQKGNLKTHMQRHSGAVAAAAAVGGGSGGGSSGQSHFMTPNSHHQSTLLLSKHHHSHGHHRPSSSSSEFASRQRAMSFSSAFGAALNLGTVGRDELGSNPDDIVNSSLSDDEGSSVSSELHSSSNALDVHSHSAHLGLAPRSFSFGSGMTRPLMGHEAPSSGAQQNSAQQAVEFHQRSMSFGTSDAAAAAAAAAARAAALYGSSSGQHHSASWFGQGAAKRFGQRPSNSINPYDPFGGFSSPSNYGATLSRLSFFSAANMHQAFSGQQNLSESATTAAPTEELLTKSPEVTEEASLTIEPQVNIVVDAKTNDLTRVDSTSVQALSSESTEKSTAEVEQHSQTPQAPKPEEMVASTTTDPVNEW